MNIRLWPVVTAVVLAVGLCIGTQVSAADETASCPTSAQAPIQLAQSETDDAPKPIACCFGGKEDPSCTIHSANSGACEWTLAYQCPGSNYTCDQDAQICRCDEPPAATGQ